MRKPVVFIPGFPATEIIFRPENWRIFPPALGDLRDDDRKRRIIEMLSDPDAPGVEAGKPVLNVLGITKQAESLYDILSGLGYDTSDNSSEFIPVGWDWRRALDHQETVDRVVSAIERLRTNGRVVAVVHSTGGLVLRAVLARVPALAEHIEHVLSFGVPWVGTLKALFAISRGEGIEVPLLGGLIGRITDEESRFIASHSQAAFDLCPADPRRTQMHDVRLFVDANGNQLAPCVDTGWIPAGSDFDYMRELAANADARFGERSRNWTGPAMTNVAGWGRSTYTKCTMDGVTLDFDESSDLLGDATAPLVSASWIRGGDVRTFFLPIGVYPAHNIPHPHVRIWDSPPVLQFFSEVLFDEERVPFVAASADGDGAMDRGGDAVLIRISAADVDGRPLPNCRAVLDLDGQRTNVPFPPTATRVEAQVSRRNLRANFGSTRFRFKVHFEWDFRDGERRPDPAIVMFNV